MKVSKYFSQSVDGSLKGSRAKRFITGLATIVIVASGCSSSPRMDARRSEAVQAGQLTQGTPKAMPLNSVASSDERLNEWEVVWVDEARQRAIPARIFAPAIKPGLALKLPLVIFSHGLGGSRLSYTQLGKHWASQGFISVHLQHAGSDRAIWTASGLAILSSLKTAASADNAVGRARDVSFAIDRLIQAAPEEKVLVERLDLSKIAVAGHSFGANTALLIAGAQFKQNGESINLRDPRVQAALILSPPSVPADQDPIMVYNPIRITTMHLTGTRDDTPIPGLSTMADQRSEAFDAMVATPRYLGVFQGGRHSMFHDRTIDATSAGKSPCNTG